MPQPHAVLRDLTRRRAALSGLGPGVGEGQVDAVHAATLAVRRPAGWCLERDVEAAADCGRRPCRLLIIAAGAAAAACPARCRALRR